MQNGMHFMAHAANRAGVKRHDVLCSMLGILRQGGGLVGDGGRYDEGFPAADIAQIQRQT